jgi:hypothetical protein
VEVNGDFAAAQQLWAATPHCACTMPSRMGISVTPGRRYVDVEIGARAVKPLAQEGSHRQPSLSLHVIVPPFPSGAGHTVVRIAAELACPVATPFAGQRRAAGAVGQIIWSTAASGCRSKMVCTVSIGVCVDVSSQSPIRGVVASNVSSW